MTGTTNTNATQAAALAVRDAAAALARRLPLYYGSGEPADEELAQAIEDLPLPDADTAERDELSEQVAFTARHLAIISGVLGSPEPIEIDDIAARLHLLIAERDELAARPSDEYRRGYIDGQLCMRADMDPDSVACPKGGAA